MKTDTKSLILLLLRLSSFFVLAGRAFQFIVWDAPLRALFWDQDIMEGLVASIFKMSWYEYSSSLAVDHTIQNIKLVMGVVFLLTAILTIIIKPHWKKTGWLFWLSTFFLVFMY